MDNLTLGLVVANLLIFAIAFCFWASKRYEAALFAVVLSPFISAVFAPNFADIDIDDPDVGIGAYIRISMLLIIGGIGYIKFWKSRSLLLRQMPAQFILLAAFLAYAMISITYSIDQRYTFVRSASFVALLGFLLGFYSWAGNRYRLDLTLNAIYILIALITAINILTLIMWPDRAWFEDDRFRGLWDHPNTLGGFSMCAYPILIWKYSRSELSKKWAAGALGIIVLGLHVLTGSRGSLLAAAFGVCVWSITARKGLRLLVISAVVLIAGIAVMQFRPASFERDNSSALTDLNGRDEFWDGAIALISEKPLMGYGYAVEGKVWSDPRFSRPGYRLWTGNARTSLHNGYLSVTVGLGVIGFALWCVVLLVPLWKTFAVPASDYKAVVLAVALPSLLLNFVETEINGTADLFWIVWVIASKLWEENHANEAAQNPAQVNDDVCLVPEGARSN
jgi:exopolysaccharide production protein ExoQ